MSVHRRVHRDRRVTVKRFAELLQHSALRERGDLAGAVIDRGGGGAGAVVVFVRLDGHDPLPRGGDHLLKVELRGDLAAAAESNQAGRGEDRAVVQPGAEFVDARVDVAAHLLELQRGKE